MRKLDEVTRMLDTFEGNERVVVMESCGASTVEGVCSAKPVGVRLGAKALCTRFGLSPWGDKLRMYAAVMGCMEGVFAYSGDALILVQKQTSDKRFSRIGKDDTEGVYAKYAIATDATHVFAFWGMKTLPVGNERPSSTRLSRRCEDGNEDFLDLELDTLDEVMNAIPLEQHIMRIEEFFERYRACAAKRRQAEKDLLQEKKQQKEDAKNAAALLKEVASGCFANLNCSKVTITYGDEPASLEDRPVPPDKPVPTTDTGFVPKIGPAFTIEPQEIVDITPEPEPEPEPPKEEKNLQKIVLETFCRHFKKEGAIDMLYLLGQAFPEIEQN